MNSFHEIDSACYAENRAPTLTEWQYISAYVAILELHAENLLRAGQNLSDYVPNENKEVLAEWESAKDGAP